MTRARGGGATILVVEDNPFVRESTVRLLQAFGHDVLAAADGAAAIRVLEAAERIDLVLTDVVMPGGMGGREVVEAARARHAGVKAMMLSAYTRSDLVDSGRIGKDTPLLSKPFRAEELERTVRDLLAGEA